MWFGEDRIIDVVSVGFCLCLWSFEGDWLVGLWERASCRQKQQTYSSYSRFFDSSLVAARLSEWLSVGVHAEAIGFAVVVEVPWSFANIGYAVAVLVRFASTVGVKLCGVVTGALFFGGCHKANQARCPFLFERIYFVFVVCFIGKHIMSCDKAIAVVVDDFQEPLVSRKLLCPAPDIAVEAIGIFVSKAKNFVALFVPAGLSFVAFVAGGAAFSCRLGCGQRHGKGPYAVFGDEVAVGSVVKHCQSIRLPVAELLSDLLLSIREARVFVYPASDVDFAFFAGGPPVALGMFKLFDGGTVPIFCFAGVNSNGENHTDGILIVAVGKFELGGLNCGEQSLVKRSGGAFRAIFAACAVGCSAVVNIAHIEGALFHL